MILLSKKNSNRPDSRDELDIDRLIRSIRSAESEAEAPQPPSPPAHPVPVETESPPQPEQLPVVHPPEERQPMTRSERDDLDPSVQQMRRQIQAMMAGWDAPGEPAGQEAPPPAPSQEPVSAPPARETVAWHIPELHLPQAERLPVEVPQDTERSDWSFSEAPSELDPAEQEPRSGRKPLFSLPFHRKPKKEAPGPILPELDTLPEQPLDKPEPAAVPGSEPLTVPPEEAPPVPSIEPVPEAPAPPPPVPEAERQAFAAGQVITLNLRRGMPEQPTARQAPSIFDQDEDDELEWIDRKSVV